MASSETVSQSINDDIRDLVARGISSTEFANTADPTPGSGILVQLTGGGTSSSAVQITDGTDTMLVNTDGSITAAMPRDTTPAGVYAATTNVGIGTSLASITPTVVGVYLIKINSRIVTGATAESVIDNIRLRNNGTLVARLLTPSVPINTVSEQQQYEYIVNWTSGAIDLLSIAASSATDISYRTSLTVVRIG